MDVFEHWENDLELEERDKVSDLRSEKPKDDRLLEFELIYQTKSQFDAVSDRCEILCKQCRKYKQLRSKNKLRAVVSDIEAIRAGDYEIV